MSFVFKHISQIKIFIITIAIFIVFGCEKEEVLVIEPYASFQISVKTSNSKLEYPEEFNANLNLVIISGKTLSDTINLIKQNNGTHKSEGNIEVPKDKLFVIEINTEIDGTYLYGMTDTIQINNSIDGVQIAKLTLTSGQIIIGTPVAIIVDMSSATLSAEIFDNGGSDIITKGFIIKENIAATSANDNIIVSGSDIGEYHATVDGLTAGTTYNVVAYAANCNDTTESETYTFTMPTSMGVVNINTEEATNITTKSANISASFLDDGGEIISQKGILWSESPNPDLSTYEGISSEEAGNNAFTSTLTGLSEGTTYYAKSYAIDSEDVNYYGNEISFLTRTFSLVTNAATDVTPLSAVVTASLNDDGGEIIDEKGFVYATFPNPDLINNEGITMEGGGNVDFSSTLSGLFESTMYYVIAYATDNTGETHYGNQISFNSLAFIAPSVETVSFSDVFLHTAIFQGNVTEEGSMPVDAKGVVYGLDIEPTVELNLGMTDEGPGSGEFYTQILGLDPGTNYYARTYASSEAGISYGMEIPFTTAQIGDEGPGGGIIFYDDGLNGGMEVGNIDTETVLQWGCATLVVNAQNIEIGGGMINTQIIVNAHIDMTDYFGNPTQCDASNDGTVAALYCSEFIQNGYDDWFLPSKEELNEIYISLHSIGLGDFTEDTYWSSTEMSDIRAYTKDFWKGTDTDYPKYGPAKLRPVRKF